MCRSIIIVAVQKSDLVLLL